MKPPRLKFRNGIRYDLPSVMRRRRSARLTERKAATGYPYVIGRFAFFKNVIVLEALMRTPAWTIATDQPLTVSLALMYRWRTRQGAHQWLKEHKPRGLFPVNLEQIAKRSVDPLTNGKPEHAGTVTQEH